MTWQWQSVAKLEDLLELLTPRLGTPLAVKDFKDFKVSVIDHGGVPEFHVFYQTGKPAQVSGKWAYRQAFDPIAVRDLLNSQGPNAGPVADARICGCWTGHQLEFHVFFSPNSAGLPAAPWNWQKAATPDGVVTFLNGAAPNALPVKNAEVVVVALPHNKTEFYIFYQNSVAEQPRDNWSWESFNDPNEVLGLLNITGPYPAPNRDLKIVTGSRQGSNLKFYAFKPQGFLIITRPMFVNSLTEYIRFKESLAFEVYVVTAEWIQDYVAGSDIRLQIRTCLRNYYYLAGVKYALLIGDSVDIQEPFNPTTYQAPPPPTLSEAWNLPAGYYHWTVVNFLTYSTLFYADLSNKFIYNENDYVPGYPGYYAFLGDYKIYVGVIPARSTGDLECVLSKTINCKAASLLTFVYSFDCYSQFSYQEFQEIQSLAGAGVSMDLFVFQDALDTTGKINIFSALFEREGIILESGHGFLNEFAIGTTWITNADAARFKFINPLFVTSSCYVQAYHMGDCLDEAFLRMLKGPAVITNGLPCGGPPTPPGTLSILTEGFWKDLLEGKTIGQAFYDHGYETGSNPLHLFGDPSLVVVK